MWTLRCDTGVAGCNDCEMTQQVGVPIDHILQADISENTTWRLRTQDLSPDRNCETVSIPHFLSTVAVKFATTAVSPCSIQRTQFVVDASNCFKTLYQQEQILAFYISKLTRSFRLMACVFAAVDQATGYSYPGIQGFLHEQTPG